MYIISEKKLLVQLQVYFNCSMKSFSTFDVFSSDVIYL